MPIYRIDQEGGPRYIWTEKEWKQFKEAYLKAARKRPPRSSKPPAKR